MTMTSGQQLDTHERSRGAIVPLADSVRRHLSALGLAFMHGDTLGDVVDPAEVVTEAEFVDGDGGIDAAQRRLPDWWPRSNGLAQIEYPEVLGASAPGFGDDAGVIDSSAVEEDPEDTVPSAFERSYGPRIPDDLMRDTPPELVPKKLEAERFLQLGLYPEGGVEIKHVEEHLAHVDRLLSHWNAIYESWSPVKRFAYSVKDTCTEYARVLVDDVVPRVYEAGRRSLTRAAFGTEEYREATAVVKERRSNLAQLALDEDSDRAIASERVLLKEARTRRWFAGPTRSNIADFVEETRQALQYLE